MLAKQCRRPYFVLGNPVVRHLKRGITTTGRSYNLKENQNENHSNVVVAEQLKGRSSSCDKSKMDNTV